MAVRTKYFFSFGIVVFLLSSCSDSCYWRYQRIKTEPACYSSELIHYVPKNSCNNIDIEFLKGEYGILGYIGVYCKEIPPASINPKTSEVVIAIENQAMRYYALRMEGGQRLLLPEAATDQLMAAFCAGKCAIIGLEGYYAEVSGIDFPSFIVN